MNISSLKNNIRGLRELLRRAIPDRKVLGYCGSNTIIEKPCYFDSPNGVYLHENVKVRHNCKIINSTTEKVVVKKYSVLAPGCTIISNSHRSTVGIPHFLLGASHINDKSADVIIEEDVWIGANVTIMAGVIIGRGAVVGACSCVTKSVPPYAVVVGTPAKIVKKKFTFEDTVEHERKLYVESERIPIDKLRKIFDSYSDLNTFGINTPLTYNQIQVLEQTKEDNNFLG